ncbi:conserved hypothetical protein [Candida dubliniensis CD36]|uniref:Proteasome chaperone 3 n=1 Tax=Candida dubliniensis (strain CD36 / ATCC MYA-646 / CBS 7987 / NCPF 3949 / NRRL Y-17841) TaxID=573826 RepID=B9W9M9_CANDC|nr:conserved hypothetical protein [Candida dubliniensis CD36]CAX45514.1 conserved hypothetical protein [Candida dubliniensis CD36]
MTTKLIQDPTGFSKSFETTYPNDTSNNEFFFHIINYNDKQIINISINGLIDTTFELPVSTKSAITYASALEISTDHFDDEDGDGEEIREREVIPEPILLIGDYANMKLSIVATQISKIISTTCPKPTILSIGSKWFGKGDEVNDDDFDKLMFILANVKTLIQ